MLGNNADAFFTTPMRHRVVSGGNVGNQSPMPVPRDVNSSATGTVITKLAGDFLPGQGAAVAPNEPVAEPAPAFLTPTVVGVGLAAAFLFLTSTGKSLRKKVGLA